MHGKTILLVDDDPNILDTAKDILEDAGYSVQTADSGAEAIQKLKSCRAKLAIFDFNLPDVRGADLAVEAKRVDKDLPIILMTGESSFDLGSAKDAVYCTL